MALIRENGTLSWDNLNRDKFLRNKDAPALFDDPITARDVRGGVEVVSRSGNVMPKAITRDKLGDDALLFPMPLNLDPTGVVQVITGYDKALNNYLYALNSAGIIRFNTLDLLAPFTDGAISLSGLTGGSVTNDRVALARTVTTFSYNQRRLQTYDFDLANGVEYNAPFQFDDAMGLNAPFTFDGQYFAIFKAAHANTLVLDAKAEDAANSTTLDSSTDVFYQKFTTGPQTTSISRVGFYGGTGAATVTIELLSDDGATVIASLAGQSFGSNLDWYEYALSATVTPNTSYRLQITRTAGLTHLFRSSGTTTYPYGNSSHASAFDFAFRVYTSVAGLDADRIERYRLDPLKTYYEYVDAIAWPGGTAPEYLMAFDRKFFYGYNASLGELVKFVIADGAATFASEQVIQESVVGIMNFNNFIYPVYALGTTLAAVPISI